MAVQWNETVYKLVDLKELFVEAKSLLYVIRRCQHTFSVTTQAAQWSLLCRLCRVGQKDHMATVGVAQTPTYSLDC